ncbi:MAG: histidinol-phosphatase [Gammaproteobacteria bacterium]|nr:histidinol-phosphatase [Gammaproteobacteria bacterium]
MDDSQHKHNFHTHTYRCKHAKGDIDDYCEAAVAMGMETLGFSDHSALPDDRWIRARMPFEDLHEYIGAIDRGRENYPDLNILKGMECEYIPEFHAYYEDELLGEHDFDYLIGAAHFFPTGGKWVGTYGGTKDSQSLRAFADYTVDMMATGLFEFIAHPDLFGNCYLQWDENTSACARDILTSAKELDIGMEINALGLRKQAYKKSDNPYPLYPWIPFWEMAAECDAPVIINSDAHRPEDLQARTGDAQAIRQELGLREMDIARIGGG